VVNGDNKYKARTTERAVELLFAESETPRARLMLEQTVETPIGGGFGASAASATSAVLASAAAVGIEKPKSELALFAHRAEIIEQTGLGTVSVIFDALGAGAITVPGEPGKSRFVTVKTPKALKIVTAFIGPYDKKDALSSKPVSYRINRLGEAALKTFMSDPSLQTLAAEGERFSEALGLESTEVKKLIRLAKAAGASYASQNMIGYSVHSLAEGERAAKVVRALSGYSSKVRVDEFVIGTRRAGLV
jgi:pantoate kinase